MKLTLNLTTDAGSAFSLRRTAREVAAKTGLDATTTNRIIVEMSGRGYQHMLNTLDREFPGVFTFLNDPRNPR